MRLNQIRRKTLLRISIIACFLSNFIFIAKESFAEDIQIAPSYFNISSDFHNSLCTSKSAIPDFGYMAEIKVMHLSKPTRNPEAVISGSELKSLAQSFARKNSDFGFSYGRCAAKTGRSHYWILSAAAPATFLLSPSHAAEHSPSRQFSRHCKRVEYWFADNKTAAVKQLKTDRIPNNTTGTLSIYCHPKLNGIGPRLWYRIPVGHDLSYAPFPEEQDLGRWVQKIRNKFSSASLKPLQDVNAGADIVKAKLNEFSTIHRNDNLRKFASAIKGKYKMEFIGEARSIGQTIDEIKINLWHSAKHRRFLIAPHAEWQYHTVIKKNRQVLFILTYFRKSSQ